MGFSHLVRSTQDPVSNDEHLSLALGGITKGVTPIEMASGFSGIANLGKQIKPTFIKQIQDSDGNVIYQYKPKIFEMIDPQNAYKMTDMLTGVVKNGSAREAILNNMPSAGKTGTTSDRKDVYFVGYTPYYTASVWIGADTPTPLDYRSSVPASLWKKVMNNINSKLELSNKPFDIPENMNEQEEFEEEIIVEEDNTRIDPNQQQQIDGLLFDPNNPNQNNQQEPQQPQQPQQPDPVEQPQNPPANPTPSQPEPTNPDPTPPADNGNQNETPPSMDYENTPQTPPEQDPNVFN